MAALFDYGYKDDLLTEKGIAVTANEFFEAVRLTAIKYRNALQYETLVGEDTDPDGHEIVFIIPAAVCENAADIAAFIGDHIYKDFEAYCRYLEDTRKKFRKE